MPAIGPGNVEKTLNLSACRSTEITRSAPATLIRSATSYCRNRTTGFVLFCPALNILIGHDKINPPAEAR
jgi:hypothetical protein